ncbi:MAG TPA: VWA domain-containing protein [Pyrinomonadaceae bacterium]
MPRRRNLLLCALFLLLSTVFSFAQQQDTSKTQSNPDVLRTNTELVQTGVSVFDKQGRFVDGLTKPDFELEVEGRRVPISFFENIVSGSVRDREARIVGSEAEKQERPPEISVRRRTIVFFIDDRHLSLDSVGRTRKTLLDFINKKMGQNDLVAIASASGQIGFLQQFTNNKDVLRAAVARLNQVPYVVTDYGKNPNSPLTEYMALTIERKDDPRVFEFYVQDCMKWALKPPGRGQGAARVQCEVEVRNRARQILIQAGTVTATTYYSLETLLHSAEKMPGSKLAFFISDGFLADTGPRAPIAMHQVTRIVDEARRAGVVIYTIDARGLIFAALDATGNVPFDGAGMLESASLREIPATQDALNALAADTGGRALRNQNYFDKFINDALAETSRYYLIAWRPETNDERNAKFKDIKIRVVGRPDLMVRAARGFTNARTAGADEHPTARMNEEKGRAKEMDADLQEALKDFYPKHWIPLQLSLIYLDTPASGPVLTTSVQVPADALSYDEENKKPARVTIAGIVLNDQGKAAATFKTGLEVRQRLRGDQATDASNVIYNNPASLKPGIYQVRVAARDERSGLLGSAMEWIVIPDLSMRQLSLSSLMMGLENIAASGERIQWSVDRKFAPGQRVKFMTFVYNAARSATGSPNLRAQVNVYRDSQRLISNALARVEAANRDPERIPFAADIDLRQLPPGAYVLQVTIEDLTTASSVSQQTTFFVQ